MAGYYTTTENLSNPLRSNILSTDLTLVNFMINRKKLADWPW